MHLCHFADVHLGIRQFERIAKSGVNQRELDVEATFNRAIDRLIRIAPDLIVIAGDIVHTPRPSNNTIIALVGGFARLTRALPDTLIVAALGNHDISKVAGEKAITQLLEPLGVHVAEREVKRFFFPDRDVSVLAVPDAPGLTRPPLEPDPRAKYNVLCCHGEVYGVQQGGAAHRMSTNEITAAELNPAAWNYCAFGHYHQYESVGANAFYSGSLDFTSSNPWQEIGTPKGFVQRDLDTGEQIFVEVTAARRFVDLPMIDATGLSPADVDAAIAAAVASVGGIDDAVVRLKIVGITREISFALDQKVLRALKKKALNFRIVEDRPDRVRAESLAALRQFETTDQRVTRELRTRELTTDVNRDDLVALGEQYLQQASERALEREPVRPIAAAQESAA